MPPRLLHAGEGGEPAQLQDPKKPRRRLDFIGGLEVEQDIQPEGREGPEWRRVGRACALHRHVHRSDTPQHSATGCQAGDHLVAPPRKQPNDEEPDCKGNVSPPARPSGCAEVHLSPEGERHDDGCQGGGQKPPGHGAAVGLRQPEVDQGGENRRAAHEPVVPRDCRSNLLDLGRRANLIAAAEVRVIDASHGVAPFFRFVEHCY